MLTQKGWRTYKAYTNEKDALYFYNLQRQTSGLPMRIITPTGRIIRQNLRPIRAQIEFREKYFKR